MNAVCIFSSSIWQPQISYSQVLFLAVIYDHFFQFHDRLTLWWIHSSWEATDKRSNGSRRCTQTSNLTGFVAFQFLWEWGSTNLGTTRARLHRRIGTVSFDFLLFFYRRTKNRDNSCIAQQLKQQKVHEEKCIWEIDRFRGGRPIWKLISSGAEGGLNLTAGCLGHTMLKRLRFAIFIRTHSCTYRHPL